MTSGGVRNRQGGQPDPNSLRSARRGIDQQLRALPREGYTGEPPEFPLDTMVITRLEYEDKSPIQVPDLPATESLREHELSLWAKAWTWPQAAAWAEDPWRWETIAMWVRTYCICATSDAKAADKSGLHRFADQIGLTPAGLRENGWKIAADEVAEQRADSQPTRTSVRDRMKVVDGGGA